jgi:hypothetical protein
MARKIGDKWSHASAAPFGGNNALADQEQRPAVSGGVRQKDWRSGCWTDAEQRENADESPHRERKPLPTSVEIIFRQRILHFQTASRLERAAIEAAMMLGHGRNTVFRFLYQL